MTNQHKSKPRYAIIRINPSSRYAKLRNSSYKDQCEYPKCLQTNNY